MPPLTLPLAPHADGAEVMRFSNVAEGIDLLVTSDEDYSTGSQCNKNGFLPITDDSWRSYGRVFSIQVRRARKDSCVRCAAKYVTAFTFSLVRPGPEPACALTRRR